MHANTQTHKLHTDIHHTPIVLRQSLGCMSGGGGGGGGGGGSDKGNFNSLVLLIQIDVCHSPHILLT